MSNGKTPVDTIPCWRVVMGFGIPSIFIYDEDAAREARNSRHVKAVYGPFDQWIWIKEKGLTPGDIDDFRWWAKYELGIHPDILHRATAESRRALYKSWYEETRE